MQRLIMTIIAIAAIFSVKAQYVLTEIKGSVRVESKKGEEKSVLKDMQVVGSDLLILGKGAEVKILNKMRKEEYTTKRVGTVSVLNRVLECRREAGNNKKVIDNFSSIGIKSGSTGKSYSQHGMANRGIHTTDEEISDVKLIAAMLRNWEYYKESEVFLPVSFNYEVGKEGCRLAINNQGSSCFYFNVFRIDSDNEVSVETYAIGDPCLNNRVENGVEWVMESNSALPEGSHHVVMISDTPYDLEEVLLELLEGKDSYDDSQAVERNKLLKVF